MLKPARTGIGGDAHPEPRADSTLCVPWPSNVQRENQAGTCLDLSDAGHVLSQPEPFPFTLRWRDSATLAAFLRFSNSLLLRGMPLAGEGSIAFCESE